MVTHPIKDIRQIKRIRNRLNKRDSMFFDLAIHTGRRSGDLVKLKKKDLAKLQFETVDINEQKTGKFIQLPIAKIKYKIVKYVNNLKDEDYLFPSRKRDKAGNRTHITTKGMLVQVKKALENEKLEGVKALHIFRKTFCYWLIKWNYGNVSVAKKIMNHSSSRYTKYYAEWWTDEMQTAMDNFKGF